MWKRNSRLFGSAATVLLLLACDGDSDARAFWKDVIAPCEVSSLKKKNLLYFGVSNYGPGTILERTADGNFELLWTAAQVNGSVADITNTHPEHECSGTRVKESKLSPSISLSSAATPMSAEVKAVFDKARTTNASASRVRMMETTGVYKTHISSNNLNPDIRADLMKEGRYYVRTAWQVGEFKADLVFKSDVAVETKAAYEGKIGALDAAKVGVGFEGHWKDNRVLHVESKGFFVGGTLAPISLIGVSGGDIVGPDVTEDLSKVRLRPRSR